MNETVELLATEAMFTNMRKRMYKRSRLLLGCKDYRTHMLVSYLEMHPYCFYCGEELSYQTATLEHLTPISLNHGLLNKPKVLACSFCNCSRGHKDLAEFLNSSRKMVDSSKVGFHFYQHLPQNGFDYVGLEPPKNSILALLREREYGLLK